MTEITPERLTQIKARSDKATAGPWQTIFGTTERPLNPYRQFYSENAVLIDGRHVLNLWRTPNPDENAAFIAAARQDIPDLIDALEAAQAENAKLREALETFAASENWQLNGVCDPNNGNFEGPSIASAALEQKP